MPAGDPLTELDELISQLADLDRQLAARQIPIEQYEQASKQLKEQIARNETRAYDTARKDKSLAKRLRMRNYNEPGVQQVCSHFINGPGQPLVPSFGIDRFPKYSVEPEKGHPITVDQALLQRMSGIGILTEILYEKLLYCPKCGTPSNVYSRFKCAQCGSIDISISRMYEHLQCGTIHQEDAFRARDTMVCPTCNKPIQRAEDYRLIGVVCSCKKCGAHFGDPVQSFFCRKCDIDFGLPTATVMDAFTYSIDKNALEEVRSYLGVPTVVRVLSAGGLEVMSPGTMSGSGGETFEFSIVARKGSNVMVIELFQSESAVEVEPVLGFYVKLLEAKPTLAVFGAVPSLSRKAHEVAKQHNILVAEGSTAADVAQRILEIAKTL